MLDRHTLINEKNAELMRENKAFLSKINDLELELEKAQIKAIEEIKKLFESGKNKATLL